MATQMTGEVKTKLLDDGIRRELLEPLIVKVGNEFEFTIPAGFQIDYASVPRPFWRLFPPARGKYLRATIPHDYLYVKKDVPKIVADAIFLDVMETDGVGWLKRHSMFLAVLLFGGWARKKC